VECLPKGCPAGGYPQEDPSAYAAALCTLPDYVS
jgi:hypothetical protein